jgi:antirestriction protein ArdC
MRYAKTDQHSSSEERLSPAERVTRQIKAALERGVRPWVKPWSADGAAPFVIPRRANGIPYRGINALALWAAAEECGYASPFWFTFKQALLLKAAVRKGERGSYVVYYSESPSKPSLDSDAEPAPERRYILRGYTVFNAGQIDGLPPSYDLPVASVPMPSIQDDARLASLFAKVPVTVRVGGDRAYYAPGPDHVQMPPKAAFADITQFYAALAHELGHATRHPSRLNRDFGQKRFGDHGYALEELVAELCAAFVGAHIGLPPDHIEDHASYIASWLQTLTDHPAAFLTAAGKAQSAADYLLSFMDVAAVSATTDTNMTMEI